MRAARSSCSARRRCRSRHLSPGRPTGSRAACPRSRSRRASRCGMARIDARDAPIDALRADDLQQALALSAEAGWNQDAADWALMLRLGHGFAIRDSDAVVATAIALPYPPVF